MLVIGIAGGTGSGKTTVVNKIIEELGNDEVVVLSQDNYYLDNSHLDMEVRAKINYDHPRAIDFELLVSHLEHLRSFMPIEQPIYSYRTHTRTEKTRLIKPKEVVIVEGILVLTNEILRSLFDIKIFVHADSDERLIRRIKRDISERGRSLAEVLARYNDTLKPMHLQFIEPTKNYADIIIPNMRRNNVAIDVMKAVILNKLNSSPRVSLEDNISNNENINPIKTF